MSSNLAIRFILNEIYYSIRKPKVIKNNIPNKLAYFQVSTSLLLLIVFIQLWLFPSLCTNVFLFSEKKNYCCNFFVDCLVARGFRISPVPRVNGPKWVVVVGRGFFCAQLSVVFSHYFGVFILNAFAFAARMRCAIAMIGFL